LIAMGIPALFHWLSQKSPGFIINAYCKDEQLTTDSDFDIDNLYLDLNGIIHPCCHPEHGEFPQPDGQVQMFNNIFLYIDQLM